MTHDGYIRRGQSSFSLFSKGASFLELLCVGEYNAVISSQARDVNPEFHEPFSATTDFTPER